MRSSVVLPEPDGPSSATSSPERMSSRTCSSAVKSPKRLVTSRIAICMAHSQEHFPAKWVPVRRRKRDQTKNQGSGPIQWIGSLPCAPLQRGLGNQRHQREQREQRGDRE